MVLELLKHRVYSVTSWVYWFKLIRVSKLSFIEELDDQPRLKSPTIIVGLFKILVLRSYPKLLFNWFATQGGLYTSTKQNLECAMFSHKLFNFKDFLRSACSCMSVGTTSVYICIYILQSKYQSQICTFKITDVDRQNPLYFIFSGLYRLFRPCSQHQICPVSMG